MDNTLAQLVTELWHVSLQRDQLQREVELLKAQLAEHSPNGAAPREQEATSVAP